MIVTCVNCAKKFNIDLGVIPEKGRLLQCGGCNHKWFFKKENIKEPIIPIKINKIVPEIDSVKIESPRNIDPLNSEFIDNFLSEKTSTNNSEEENSNENTMSVFSKKKKNRNLLAIPIVFMISFIALIIVLDTFQLPISKIVPDIEFFLYNLYETIKDIKLFLTDLAL